MDENKKGRASEMERQQTPRRGWECVQLPKQRKTVSVDLATVGQQRRTQSQLPLSQRRKTVYSRNTAIIKKDGLHFGSNTEEWTTVTDVLKSIRDLFTISSTCVVKEPSKELYVHGNKEVTTEDTGRIYTYKHNCKWRSIPPLSGFSTVGSPETHSSASWG